MTTDIYKFECREPPFDAKEAERYAGMRGEDEGVRELLMSCYERSHGVLSYRACYRVLTVDEPLIEALIKESRSARDLLSGCERVILFAATVGSSLDRLIARASHTSCTEALLINAIGAERVESLCDELCRSLGERFSSEGYTLTRRFSPGYGDIPLSVGAELLSLVDAQRVIGVALNESMLMSPSKSVSAIIGVKPE